MHFLATLGIELPIVQAPMAGVQGSPLALAVCRAGGLGSLPAAMIVVFGWFLALTAAMELGQEIENVF